MFWVYVIKNESGKIYIGQTSNLQNRLKRHNQILPNKTKSYTRINKGPWKIVYKERHKSRQEVLGREKYLKSHIGRDWIRRNFLGR